MLCRAQFSKRQLPDPARHAALLEELGQVEPLNGFLCHTRGLEAQALGNMRGARECFIRGQLHVQNPKAALLNYEGLAELETFRGERHWCPCNTLCNPSRNTLCNPSRNTLCNPSRNTLCNPSCNTVCNPSCNTVCNPSCSKSLGWESKNAAVQ
jgi:hypothetical protein